MFERIFIHAPTIDRYRAAPLLEERVSYLEHCLDGGACRAILQRTAINQLRFVRLLPLNGPRTVSVVDIEAVVRVWSRPGVFRTCQTGALATKRQCVRHLIDWMRFLGWFEEPEGSPPHPYVAVVAEFSEWAREERGYSEQSIEVMCDAVNGFFTFLSTFETEISLADVAMPEIDRAFEAKSAARTLSKATMSNYASRLRVFFRFGEERGLCKPGLADALKGPRMFTNETMPVRLTRDDALRVLATTEGDGRIAIRDRAVLMLLVVYGLRSGEVRNLRLDDLDWVRETLRVRRSKSGRQDLFPLSSSVAQAVQRYIREVRPSGHGPYVFLTVVAPFRPLTRSALIQIVGARVRRVGIVASRRGPHALRHAAAQHLFDQGMTLKTIGNFLGHTNLSSTQVYVRVGLRALREVAEFDVGFLL